MKKPTFTEQDLHTLLQALMHAKNHVCNNGAREYSRAKWDRYAVVEDKILKALYPEDK